MGRRDRARRPRRRGRSARSPSTSTTSSASTTTHGHEIGDRVLAWLGALLKEQARGVDVAARVGGEEFVVLLPRADARRGRTFAERVRRAVATRRAGRAAAGAWALSDALRLTVSAGVAAAIDADRRPGAAGARPTRRSTRPSAAAATARWSAGADHAGAVRGAVGATA